MIRTQHKIKNIEEHQNLRSSASDLAAVQNNSWSVEIKQCARLTDQMLSLFCLETVHDIIRFCNHLCIWLDSAGHYVYIETSSPRRPGESATLVSPTYLKPRNNSACKLNFAYHMYGASIGSLAVVIKPVGGVAKVLTNMTGNRGNLWRSASISISSTTDFQVSF